MGRQAQENNHGGNINNGQQIDRSFNRGQNEARAQSETRGQNDATNFRTRNENAQPTQSVERENILRSNEEQRMTIERAQRAQQGQPQNSQRELPRYEAPRNEAPRTEAPRTYERSDNNNRQMRVDDSATRRVEAPRAERSGGDNGNSRAGRHGRDDDRRD
jgi:hypothetical protein